MSARIRTPSRAAFPPRRQDVDPSLRHHHAALANQRKRGEWHAEVCQCVPPHSRASLICDEREALHPEFKWARSKVRIRPAIGGVEAERETKAGDGGGVQRPGVPHHATLARRHERLERQAEGRRLAPRRAEVMGPRGRAHAPGIGRVERHLVQLLVLSRRHHLHGNRRGRQSQRRLVAAGAAVRETSAVGVDHPLKGDAILAGAQLR
mmetsp:Transcript_105694/g.336555  ORF Transcript_105694/g.336555 Transcript_105694/m.336555 type:complete len:208 (-) Transcript_105694:299-922(-)